MAASLVFPNDYKGDTSSGPMLGFGACEILEGSGVGGLELGTPEQWTWLPVPTEGLSTSYIQGWEESQVNVMAAAADKGVNFLTEMMGGGKKEQGSSGGDGGEQTTNSGVLNVGSVATAAAELVKAKFGLASGITKRALEQVYVSYSGPQFRSHSFSFSLRPKSEAESETIRNIIKFFKTFSAPENLGGLAEIIRLYKTPHLFNIVLIPTTETFPLIGASALTEFGVKYGGDKFTVFEGNEPVQVDITLSFKEMIVLDRGKVKAGY